MRDVGWLQVKGVYGSLNLTDILLKIVGTTEFELQREKIAFPTRYNTNRPVQS